MITPQFVLPLNDELVIDLFAGGGGASAGIEQAIGRHVDIAVNHSARAVAMHEVNHPQTQHFISDVFEVEPLTVCAGRPVGLLWASPDCKHFSKAKGARPVSNKIRGLAWVVVKWAKEVKPRLICLENVEEFQTWGPIGEDGKPCPLRRGETFEEWKQQLRDLGYVIEHRELRGCDFGAPTIRKRFFLVARCDGAPIVWPAPTHGPGRAKKYRVAADCIDWSLPCPSIFERKKELAPATLRRIAHGVKRYVIDSAAPFIVPVTHQGDNRVHSIDDPLRTITTAKRGEFSLCAPTLIDAAHGDISPSGVKRWGKGHRSITEPLPTVTASGGNSALVAAYLAKHFGGEPEDGKTCTSLDKPAPTVTCRDHSALVSAQLVGCGGRAGQSRPRNGDEPMATITTKADTSLITSHLSHFYSSNTRGGEGSMLKPLKTVLTANHAAEVRALLIKYYGTDGTPQLGEPLHTITTRDRFGLVTVKGETYRISDIGMRMLQPPELYKAQGFPATYVFDRGSDGKPFTKEQQVHMCGNSVCPPVAAALVSANYTQQQALKEAA